jgi:hypothetical protein
MNSNLRKEENIYYKVLSVIKRDEDDDEDNITNKENFEHI